MDVQLNLFDFFRPSGVPYAILILIASIILARFVTQSLEQLGQRFSDRRLVIHQFGSLARFGIYFVGALGAAAAMFYLRREVILAFSGLAAVAVGFALKDLIASVVAGVIILVDRPFQVGDRVTFDGYYGEIRHIGLRSVRLMTLDDTQVTIPNSKFLTDSVASGNAGDIEMMIQLDFYVGIDQDATRARQIVTEALTSSRYVTLERRWKVVTSLVIESNYIAVRLRAKAYIMDVQFEKDFETDVTERVLEGLRAEGIHPPAMLRRDLK